jgi:hypothetical protein
VSEEQPWGGGGGHCVGTRTAGSKGLGRASVRMCQGCGVKVYMVSFSESFLMEQINRLPCLAETKASLSLDSVGIKLSLIPTV